MLYWSFSEENKILYLWVILHQPFTLGKKKWQVYTNSCKTNYRNKHPEVICKKSCTEKFYKLREKTPLPRAGCSPAITLERYSDTGVLLLILYSISEQIFYIKALGDFFWKTYLLSGPYRSKTRSNMNGHIPRGICQLVAICGKLSGVFWVLYWNIVLEQKLQQRY